eukprot:CAMPEP_0174369562 /NCGR_PEP_ID=MMETSP0811_2-20130205/92926_1 /TAXON_ID=73025 ORGANISM="Eutreptiella gymnastica-like, Strain CCMP1594" /NCGR_SAMPLE_ID=MMETSP0811_2 /ASSEMBLY_ACC=CAM_ASM_000667 /LENGTH=69 /DNA_ID=CAMNT_0015514121 /DNA_START=754 /DNA_END=960 /DNA_ORIENTATION=-
MSLPAYTTTSGSRRACTRGGIALPIKPREENLTKSRVLQDGQMKPKQAKLDCVHPKKGCVQYVQLSGPQ